jgi:hypothetical protein
MEDSNSKISVFPDHNSNFYLKHPNYSDHSSSQAFDSGVNRNNNLRAVTLALAGILALFWILSDFSLDLGLHQSSTPNAYCRPIEGLLVIIAHGAGIAYVSATFLGCVKLCLDYRVHCTRVTL